MTRKERRFLLEGIAIVGALTMLILFVIPTMINARESVAFVIAILIVVGAFGWLGYYLYRITGEAK